MDNSLKKWRITRHSNKIGLFDTDNQTFINQTWDVVLSFPFKDCILEGWMSNEDLWREEKFFHETIDRTEIDTLRDPKVFTGFEKIDKNGIHKIQNPDDLEFFNQDGELKENLLIKWNNLIALYSLRQKLAWKIKLIYIDPPYNTGNDGFRYNDSFNHSTWLVFMRNRLEAARDLLSEDWVIFVQCDDNEQAYLKVLMDEVFGREKFVTTLIWHKKTQPSFLSKEVASVKEFILFFKKWNEKIQTYWWETDPDKLVELINISNQNTERYFASDSVLFSDSSFTWIIKKWIYGNHPLEIEVLDDLKITDGKPAANFTLKGKFKWSQEKMNESFWLGDIYHFKSTKSLRPTIERASKETNVKPILDLLSKKINDEIPTNTDGSNELAKIFSSKLVFSNPKPVSLIEYLIKSICYFDKDAIILDFHSGSWTTWHAVLSLNSKDSGNRKFILIEQMNYIEDIAKVRLQKVIESECKDESFIYMELKAYNIEFINKIEQSRTKDDLHKVYVEMATNAFLQFWFDRKDFERDENYKALPLEEQKIKLRELLDMNQLYLNYGDMNDTRHQVTHIEKSLTEKFYGKE